MNKKVLKTFIILIWFVLAAFAIVKIFFGEWFVVQVSNDRVKEIGEYIDSHEWALTITYFCTRYFTYFFYLCACLRVWNLTLHKHIALTMVTLFMIAFGYLFGSFMATMDIMIMVVFPFLCKADFKQEVTVLILHYFGQFFLLFIRSKPLLMIGQDIATQFITSLDAYLWLVLYYLYANLYKEETLWDTFARRFSETRLVKRLSKNSKE